MATVTGVISGATIVLSPIAKAVTAMYKMGDSVNDFLDKHIDSLKHSEQPTIASTGRVLEAAKFGFGLGYMSSIAIIATGQVILGNTFSAAGTIAAGVTLTNPIAMTCAAVGAIYYGWNALSDIQYSQTKENPSKQSKKLGKTHKPK